MTIRTYVYPKRLMALEAEVTEFERRYGLPSHRMVEVFHEGEPDVDQRRWSSSYQVLMAARRFKE